MKKYRIKFSQGWFIPQYKLRFIPFWFQWKCSHTGFDYSVVMFDSEDGAREYIEQDKASDEEWEKTKAMKTRIIKV